MNEILQMDGEAPFDDIEGNAAFGRLFNKFLAKQVTTGEVTVNGVTPVAVQDANFKVGSSVQFTLKTVGGTVGAIPKLVTATPGTGFDVAATASDTSVYIYTITNLD